MSEVLVETLAPEEVVSALLRRLDLGKIEEATGYFADDFRFKDNGIGLEFRDKDQLTEFLRRRQEIYPDYFLKTDQMLVSGDHVILQWALRVTLTEPFYAGLKRRVPISLDGASIVRIDDGKIVEWSDYYDGLTSRRTRLTAHFREWTEY